MVYFVMCDMQAGYGFSFNGWSSDRYEERKRIGDRIRDLREEQNLEGKQLAALAKIDAGNLSKIEQGKYSVGFDILAKIADVLGAKVDLV